MRADAAFALAGDVAGLVRFAKDRSRAPEARLLAAALTLAEHELAVDERRVRTNISREQLAVIGAGLRTTRSPFYYDSIYSPLPPAFQPGDSGMPAGTGLCRQSSPASLRPSGMPLEDRPAHK